MNSDSIEEKDLLRDYMNPKRVEAAPEGLEERIMDMVEQEAALPSPGRNLWPRIKVPAVSVGLTFILFAAVLILVPRAETGFFAGFFSAVDNIRITLPELKTDWLYSISVPAIVLYIGAGLLALSLLDRILSRIFSN